MLHRDTGEGTSFIHTKRRNDSMEHRDLTHREETNGDHWEMLAEATDLTIEGHRLIAQEIGHEMKLLWRHTMSWLRGLAGMPSRRASPPV